MKNDGGPAFPSLDIYEGYDSDREQFVIKSDAVAGMSLRDYFAAKAMQALLSNPNVIQASDQRGWELVNCNTHGIALEAYTQADAMLKEREK